MMIILMIKRMDSWYYIGKWSMQEDESVKICVGSWINCCETYWDVIASILEPSYVAVSCL